MRSRTNTNPTMQWSLCFLFTMVDHTNMDKSDNFSLEIDSLTRSGATALFVHQSLLGCQSHHAGTLLNNQLNGCAICVSQNDLLQHLSIFLHVRRGRWPLSRNETISTRPDHSLSHFHLRILHTSALRYVPSTKHISLITPSLNSHSSAFPHGRCRSDL